MLLADDDVEFVIIGGFCLGAHGAVRGTKDLDIFVASDRENLTRLAGALDDLQAEPVGTDDFDSSELAVALTAQGLQLGGNRVLRTRLGRLDIFQSTEGVKDYPTLRSRAIQVEVPGVGEHWFAGLDDLIAMKSAAGRPQDEIDITSLERARLASDAEGY